MILPKPASPPARYDHGFAIVNSSKIEWAMDGSIHVKHMNVLLGNHQVILNSVPSRRALRLDQMTVMRLIRMK